VGSGAKPQPANDFVHIGVQKVQLWWQQFLLIFLGRNVIICAQNELDIVRRRVQFLTARRPVRRCSRHCCRMEVCSAYMAVAIVVNATGETTPAIFAQPVRTRRGASINSSNDAKKLYQLTKTVVTSA